MLFRKIQNIFSVGLLNDCSKFWLGGQVAAICFPPVWWKFRRWIWCRWAVRKLQRFVALQIWPDTNCALWHSRVTFRASWVTRFAMLQMGCPSCFSVRQTKPVLKNVNEVQELRVLNQSWKCVMKSWYILSALIWHTCDNWPNPSPLQADYCTMFEICSRIEAHLVGYSCPQTWVDPMYDVIWILEGDSRWMSPAVSKARTPKVWRTAWPGSGMECLSVWQGNKRVLRQFWRYSTDNLFPWVNYGGPLAYRAYQSITTCQYSMSLDMILTAGERGPSRSLDVGCFILCQPWRFLISGFRWENKIEPDGAQCEQRFFVEKVLS